MAFFKKPPTSQAALLSQRLYSICKKHNHADDEMPKVWIKHFTKLLTGNKYSEIIETLTWWEEWLRKPDSRGVWTAEAWCQEYQSFRREMYLTEKPAEMPPDLAALAARLKDELKFPPEIAAVLPAIVIQSTNAWNKFAAKIQNEVTINSAAPENSMLDYREAAFLTSILVFSPDMIESWVHHLSTAYGTMEHYTGRLTNLILDPSNRAFALSFWGMWSEDWCGEPTKFNSLLNNLLKE
jgi:hypothetical protein